MSETSPVWQAESSATSKVSVSTWNIWPESVPTSAVIGASEASDVIPAVTPAAAADDERLIDFICNRVRPNSR